MPISDFWPDLEASLEQLDEPTSKRITSLHDHLLPYSTHISEYATSLHPRRLPCTLITSVYTWGQSFLVYELVFEDPAQEDASKIESWVARFGLPPYEGDEFFNTPEQLERKILNEVGALRVVKERTTVPVPTIFGYCARHGDGFQEKFGGAVEEGSGVKRKPHPLGETFPAFILMSALRGKTIEECGIPIHELGGHWDMSPSTEEAPYFTSPVLRNYLSSLASIHLQISQITFSQIGSFTMDDETGEVRIGPMAEFGLGPFDTAEEYYATIAEAFKRIAEASQEEEEMEDDEPSEVVLTIEHDDDNSTTVTLSSAQVKSLRRIFTAAIFPLALGPHVSSSNDRGPFPMRHGDLHSENILVDEETGNIIGVIDWEGAGTVPWEVAGGLNWEVHGNADASLDGEATGSMALKRPEIHAAFNRALKQEEEDMSRWFKPIPKTPTHLKLDPKTVKQSPVDVTSPSSSLISLSSSSSSSSENIGSMSDFGFGKTHSRSSSSSKSNLTAFTSPPTSPASSFFDLSRKENEEASDAVAALPTPQPPPISIFNTPPSPPPSNVFILARDLRGSPGSTKKFSRAASEPPNAFETAQEDQQTQHSRSVSLSPVIIEAVREPLPADYLKQMVNKSEISFSMAAMSIRSARTPLTTSPPALSNLIMRSPPASTIASSVGIPPSPSTHTRSPFRGSSMHRRKQSSIAIGPLPPFMPSTPSGSPLHSPALPFNLYGPAPLAPAPLLAASLSLPLSSGKRHGSRSGSASPSPSPSPTPGIDHTSRSPSPLTTPLATSHPSHVHPHHGPGAFNFNLGHQKTPSAHPHAHPFGHSHSRTPSSSHSYFLPPSLSRSVSASYSHRTVTPTPSQPDPSAASLAGTTSRTRKRDSVLTVVQPPVDNGPPVKSPEGSTLAELHGSVGSYVASYLAHWMFVFGCEYETVGKALWDVILCARKEMQKDATHGDEKKAVDVDDAFWVWVKETLENNGEEEEAVEDKVEKGALVPDKVSRKESTVEALVPQFKVEEFSAIQSAGPLLAENMAAIKAIDRLD